MSISEPERLAPPSENVVVEPSPSPIPSSLVSRLTHSLSTLLSRVSSALSDDKDSALVTSVSIGALKGALISLVPALLLERRLTPSTLRRSLALSAFVSCSRLLERLVPRSLPLWRAIVGALASVAALRIDPSWARRRVLVAWLSLRAARAVVPSSLSESLGPLGPTIVMMLASAPVLAAWIFAPKQLDPVFVSFLNTHGGQRVSDIALFRSSLPPLSAPCACVHPGLSCQRHAALFLLAASARSFKLYAPLHLLLVLASPEPSFVRYVRSLLHSTVFLGLYCTFAWQSACLFFRHAHEGVARAPLLLPTLGAGLATLAERPSRQAELAVYVAAYAVDSLASWLGPGSLRFLPRALPEMLAVSAVAILFHHHDQLPHVVSRWLLRLK